MGPRVHSFGEGRHHSDLNRVPWRNEALYQLVPWGL